MPSFPTALLQELQTPLGGGCVPFHFCMSGDSYEVIIQSFGHLLPKVSLRGWKSHLGAFFAEQGAGLCWPCYSWE